MDKDLFIAITKKAHRMTRQMKLEFPEINYRTEFVICFKMLYADEENNKNKVNLKINKIIKKNNNFKFAKTKENISEFKEEINNKFKNVKEFENINKFNKQEKFFIENKKINYEKGSKHLLDKGEIEILNIFKNNEIEMIEFLVVNSGIIEVTTKVTLISDIFKHNRRRELKAIDTYKINLVDNTLKESVEIIEYTYSLPVKTEKNKKLILINNI